MLSLEQVRVLEDRVEKAVAYIAGLREERDALERRLSEAQASIDSAAVELAAAEQKVAAAEEKSAAAERRAEESGASTKALVSELEAKLAAMSERVSAAETRAAELASRAEEYRKDQAQIEEGIVHALEKLDSFEDLVLSTAVQPQPAASGIAVKVQTPTAPTKPALASAKPATAPTKAAEAPVGTAKAPVTAPAVQQSDETIEPPVGELDIF